MARLRVFGEGRTPKTGEIGGLRGRDIGRLVVVAAQAGWGDKMGAGALPAA
jgi:hypothetical protein